MGETEYSTGEYLKKNLADIIVKTSLTSSAPGTAKSLVLKNNGKAQSSDQ